MAWIIFDGERGVNNIFDSEINKSKKHKRDDLLVPFKTKTDNKRYEDFSGVVGAFSKIMSGSPIKCELDRKSFFENLHKNLDGCPENEFKILCELIDNMYFENGKLLPINVRALNYIGSNTTQQQVAEYLYSLFIKDTDLKDLYQAMEASDDTNVLEQLVFRSIQGAEEGGNYSCQDADCLLPYVKKVFYEDFSILIQDSNYYKAYVDRFLAYYYMFYISQLSVKLMRFESGIRSKQEKVFLTLNWEIVSKVRPGYEYGWKYVKENLGHMFSHSVVMEMLSHNLSQEHLDYIGYYEKFHGTDKDEIVAEEIKQITDMYQQWIPMDYSKCIHNKSRDTECKTSNEMRRLFEVVDYQFIYGGRKSHYNGYNRKFIDFVQHNFGKRRGTLGYTLGVNEGDIIMFTNIILRTYNGKISLSKLFKEFERRGLIFDRESKKNVTELFEKMNLLEKRSDSGDAQYVKTVL